MRLKSAPEGPEEPSRGSPGGRRNPQRQSEPTRPRVQPWGRFGMPQREPKCSQIGPQNESKFNTALGTISAPFGSLQVGQNRVERVERRWRPRQNALLHKHCKNQRKTHILPHAQPFGLNVNPLFHIGSLRIAMLWL